MCAQDSTETTTKIVIGGDAETETIYPDEQVSLEEQRRHFCLMLASEQQVTPDKIVDLAEDFNTYLATGKKPTKPRVVS